MFKCRRYLLIVALQVFSVLFNFSMLSGDSGFGGKYLFDQILIRGTTNLNHFQIVYNERELSLFAPADSDDVAYVKMSIPVNEFQTNNKVLLQDFLKIIQADRFPSINIFLENDITRKILADVPETKQKIMVQIGEIKNAYECVSYLEKSYYNEWYFTGKLNIRLTDFKIDPPEKFLGLIKVKDLIEINFKILFVIDN